MNRPHGRYLLRAGGLFRSGSASRRKLHAAAVVPIGTNGRDTLGSRPWDRLFAAAAAVAFATLLL